MNKLSKTTHGFHTDIVQQTVINVISQILARSE